jgi:hypothetical protein
MAVGMGNESHALPCATIPCMAHIHNAFQAHAKHTYQPAPHLGAGAYCCDSNAGTAICVYKQPDFAVELQCDLWFIRIAAAIPAMDKSFMEYHSRGSDILL